MEKYKRNWSWNGKRRKRRKRNLILGERCQLALKRTPLVKIW
jgi:hypothetical protein